MKKIIVACMAVAIICAISVQANADTETTFAIYASSGGTQQLTEIELDNAGLTLQDSYNLLTGENNYRYLAGKAYIQVTPGTDPGNWYLVAYTSNRADDSFNRGNDSTLFIKENDSVGEPLPHALIWKYRNEVLNGETTSSIGMPIYFGWDSYFKYFINEETGDMDAVWDQGVVDLDHDGELTELENDAYQTYTPFWYATIIDYTYTWSWASNRIQLAFGIQLGNAYRKGDYGTTLNFEMYVR